MPTILELLEALPRHFESVSLTRAAANRAMGVAIELVDMAKAERMSGKRGSVIMEQPLVVAARTLSDFATLTAREAAGGHMSARMLTQVWAGINAAYSCALLACTLERLEPQAAFAVGAAFSLVFGPGSIACVPSVKEQQMDAAIGLCTTQLGAVVLLVTDLLPRQQPRVAAALANSTAKPAALMRWLAALCCALQFLHDGADPVKRGMMCVGLVDVLEVILTTELFARHQEWLAGDAMLQQVVADALLAQGLAALPGLLSAAGPEMALGEQALQRLPGLLWHPSLAPAIVQRLHTPGPGGAAAVQHAAAVVEALPLPRPDAMPAKKFAQMHGHAIMLLNVCCQLQRGLPTHEGSNDTAGSGGSSSYGTAGNGSSSGENSGGSSGASSDQQAAWQLVALAPRLVATVQALADDPDGPAAFPGNGWLDELDSACNNTAASLQLLEALDEQPASAAQLASWAAASTAGLRLQPLLLQLDAQLQQRQPPPPQEQPLPRQPPQQEEAEEPQQEQPQQLQERPPGDEWAELRGTQHLSEACIVYLWGSMPRVELGAASQEELAQLAASLAELHATTCRLVQFVVSRGSPALAARTACIGDVWTDYLAQLTAVFRRMLNAKESVSEPGTVPYELQGACAAHLQAVLAVAAAAAGDARGTEDKRWPAILRDVLMAAVANCPGMAEAAWDRSVDAAFEAVVAHVVQVSSPLELASEFLCPMAEVATSWPRLAAAVASSSLLGRMLQTAEQLAGSEGEDAAEWAAKLLDSFDATVRAAIGSSLAADASATSLRITASQLAELQAAAGALDEQQQQVLGELPPDASLAERAAQLRQLVQPASQFGSLVLDMVHSPDAEAHQRMELAKAAATRPCAYLRCANLAGQGVGTAKCSACRAVWYCGTACSHADWRAGHKRVCKALAAERQAAKAARAAAAGQQEDAA